ncbi:MAG: flavodoxin family protein [Eubacteriaceae bacterium]|nr:flavodoxin family protein [Eubacteriaceae bacterium]
MKTIIINASPRNNFNTALLLKEAAKGAEEVGEVKYIDLYDLSFSGCVSCLSCKNKAAKVQCRCYHKDDITDIINEIYTSDHLIIGSPIYFSQVTAGFRAVMERAVFPALSYNDYKSTFGGKVDVDIFLTMNVGKEGYEKMYKDKFAGEFGSFGLLNGKVNIYPFCDTLQVEDYSKYNMAGFSEEHKRKVHEEEFPKCLEMAYGIGKGIK